MTNFAECIGGDFQSVATGAARAQLNQWFAPRGPCRLCAHTDDRHRLWDNIVVSELSDAEEAARWQLPLEAIRAVRALWTIETPTAAPRAAKRRAFARGLAQRLTAEQAGG